jgi:predicted phage baseplate assembly protein
LAIIAELRRRRGNFTPEWEDSDPKDAGRALAELFGFQLALVARRVNRLPEKLTLDLLRLAGVQPASVRPARGVVTFTVSQAARESVPIPQGFQVGAAPATGTGDVVVFETEHGLMATPGQLAQLLFEGQRNRRDFTALNESQASYRPLGDQPEPGDALLLGLKLPDRSRLTESLSLYIQIASPPGNPPPVSSGSVSPVPLAPRVVLQWEARVGNLFQPVPVETDETANLWRSGLVQLKLPAKLVPSAIRGSQPLVWFRLRLLHGQFPAPPEFSSVQINAARVKAVETVRNEVLQPLDRRSRQQMKLKRQGAVPDSLRIVSEETVLADDGVSDRLLVQRWERVDDLQQAGPNDAVFEFDPTTGIVTFGDGVHGAALPPGFRNVRAEQYEISRGAESAVGAEQITVLLKSAPFVTGVTNPWPVSGGEAQEPTAMTVRRGPETIRAGHRAVARADFAVLAAFAPGASIGRAYALPGYHPHFPGRRIPGLVGVLVVSRGEEEGLPVPDEQTLQSVARYLSSTVAAAGAEIVACAPRFRRLRAEAGFMAGNERDLGELARGMEQRITRFLHPLTGGRDGEGWPFGGTLKYADLLNVLLTEDPSGSYRPPRAIPRLRFLLDGVPMPRCEDIPLKPDELFWPEHHQVLPLGTEVSA